MKAGVHIRSGNKESYISLRHIEQVVVTRFQVGEGQDQYSALLRFQSGERVTVEDQAAVKTIREEFNL